MIYKLPVDILRKHLGYSLNINVLSYLSICHKDESYCYNKIVQPFYAAVILLSAVENIICPACHTAVDAPVNFDELHSKIKSLGSDTYNTDRQ